MWLQVHVDNLFVCIFDIKIPFLKERCCVKNFCTSKKNDKDGLFSKKTFLGGCLHLNIVLVNNNWWLIESNQLSQNIAFCYMSIYKRRSFLLIIFCCFFFFHLTLHFSHSTFSTLCTLCPPNLACNLVWFMFLVWYNTLYFPFCDFVKLLLDMLGTNLA